MCPPATPAPWNPSSPPPCAPRRMPAQQSQVRDARPARQRAGVECERGSKMHLSRAAALRATVTFPATCTTDLLPLLSLPRRRVTKPDNSTTRKRKKRSKTALRYDGAATAGNNNKCCCERDPRLRRWRPSPPAIVLYSLGGSSLHPMATPSRPSLPYSCAPPAVAAGGRGNHYGGRLPMRCHHRLKHGERCASCLHDADLRSAACPLADVG